MQLCHEVISVMPFRAQVMTIKRTSPLFRISGLVLHYTPPIRILTDETRLKLETVTRNVQTNIFVRLRFSGLIMHIYNFFVSFASKSVFRTAFVCLKLHISINKRGKNERLHPIGQSDNFTKPSIKIGQMKFV